MTKFRKKPVVIEAIQFLGTPESANKLFDEFEIPGAQFVPNLNLLSGVINIPTLEGIMTAICGDFIIKGIKGEFYPCKPDIFEQTYDAVSDSSDKDFNNLLSLGKGTFGMAIEAAKQGYKIARSGWNGKGMFAFFVNGSTFKVNRKPLNEIYEEGTEVNYRPHIDLKAVDGTVGVWNPNMMDILAEDWCVVN